MPVPILGPEVGSDSQKVKFLMMFGRPKTGFFDQISGALGYIPPIPASYQPRSLTAADPVFAAPTAAVSIALVLVAEVPTARSRRALTQN